MIAILKKEVKGYLTSMVGYVFIAFMLVVSGIYFTAYHLNGAYPKFAYTLSAVLVVFLIAVPILTMRILAEERRQKTDQLLLTSPVSVPEIVIGKYLALVCIFFIVVLALAFYPLVLSQFGSIPYGETYAALFGFWLMGCSFLAIGLYISSITESQVIAAVLTFLVLFVCYLMEGIHRKRKPKRKRAAPEVRRRPPRRALQCLPHPRFWMSRQIRWYPAATIGCL